MTEQLQETWYLALKKLMIPNAPGSVPSIVKVEVGQRFALDGTEPINLSRLLNAQAMRPLDDSPEESAFIKQMADKRAAERARAAKRPTRKRNGIINGQPAE